MTFTIRRLLLVVFGLAFVPRFLVSRLQAQYASPPQTYSITQVNSMVPMAPPGVTFTQKIYRDGSKALMDQSYPPMAKNPKGYHSRALYDLQAHKNWLWLPDETSMPCGAGTFSGDWGDPFANSPPMTPDALRKLHLREVGMETLNGIATKVFEPKDPQGGGGKLWLDAKYGLIIKLYTIAKNGQHQTMLEVKEFSLAKPPASVFALPPACASAPITAHSESTLGPGGEVTSHAEAQIGLPGTSAQTPASESQKGPPPNAPSQESASQISVPSGTHVSAEYEDGTWVKLKPEEQVALIFVKDIIHMEEDYLSCYTDKPCSLDELIKGVKREGGIRLPIRLSRDPNQDPNYRYTVTKPGFIQVEAIPRRPGLGGFLYLGAEDLFDRHTYYNPNGAASMAAPNGLTPGPGTKLLRAIFIEGLTFKR